MLLEALKTSEVGSFSSDIKIHCEREISDLYSAAYSAYIRADYDEATDLFTYLLWQNPHEPLFWKGLASARQMGKSPELALKAWATVCLLDETGREEAHYHAAECLIDLGKIEGAIEALTVAAVRGAKQEEALALLAHLQRNLSHG